MKKTIYMKLMLVGVVALAACGKRPDTTAAPAEPIPTPAAETAPVAEARSTAAVSPYEGKIVRRAPTDGGKQDGWFYVKNGKRRWIVDAGWLETQGLKPEDVIEIPADALSAIPEEAEPLTTEPQQ
jgi:hypothetical protein